MLVRPLSFLHHHHSPSPSPFAPNDTQRRGCEPLPSHEGCGPYSKTLTHLRSEVAPQPPLPFPKGCGRFIVVRRRIGGGRNIRGDPGSGRPMRCVSKTNHDWKSWFVFAIYPPIPALLTSLGCENDPRR